MEIDNNKAAYEQRMEEYARRQTKALESLANHALWWTIVPFLGAVLVLIYLAVAD